MRIGIDINERNINAVILTRNDITKFEEKSIYDVKRDTNRVIMDKLISIIHKSTESRIKGIGLSLPSRIDEKRGVIFDLTKIPYWKGHGIKKILEDEFNTRIWINNDVNCCMLAEKHHGSCMKHKNILCIHIDCHVAAGITVNGKLFVGDNDMFNHSKCLSTPCYDYICVYKESFIRTVEELNFLCSRFNKNKFFPNKEEAWDEFGTLLGRLISILFQNYKFEAVVLDGRLGKSNCEYVNTMNEYIAKYIHVQNLPVYTSSIMYSKALGATSLIDSQDVLPYEPQYS